MLDLIRMSTLRNVPVVLGQRQIGLIQDACFDETRKQVYAFVVACGMRGKKLVPVKHVRVLSEQFILIDGLEKYRHTDRQKMSLFVRDTTGILVGRVTDYAIDIRTMEVLALEMIPGYSLRDWRRRIWLYAYRVSQDRNELSIPLHLLRQSCFLEEENDACECPP